MRRASAPKMLAENGVSAARPRVHCKLAEQGLVDHEKVRRSDRFAMVRRQFGLLAFLVNDRWDEVHDDLRLEHGLDRLPARDAVGVLAARSARCTRSRRRVSPRHRLVAVRRRRIADGARISMPT